MDDTIKYFVESKQISKLTQHILFSDILEEAVDDDKFPKDIFMKLLCSYNFNQYLGRIPIDYHGNVIIDGNFDQINLLINIFDKIHAEFNLREIRTIIITSFTVYTSGQFLQHFELERNEREWTDSVIKYCKHILMLKKYGRSKLLIPILIEHGIPKHIKYIPNNYLESTHLHRIDYKKVLKMNIELNWELKIGVQLTKHIVRKNRTRVYYVPQFYDRDDMIKAVCISKFCDSFERNEYICITEKPIQISLEMIYRKCGKSLAKILKNTATTNKIMLIEILLRKILAKFTTKNMTKLILYYL